MARACRWQTRSVISELDGVPRMEPEDVDPDAAREMTYQVAEKLSVEHIWS